MEYITRLYFRLTFACLFRHQGHIGAALVLGGVDSTGPHLFTIHPHGSTDKLPYVTMGSGSLAAMAVFESGWRKDMSVRSSLSVILPYALIIGDVLAWRRAKTRNSRCISGYLQRSWIRLKRWRISHHAWRREDTSWLRQAQRTCTKREEIWVQKGNDSLEERDHTRFGR